MPVSIATPEETQALFGNGLILFGMKRPTSSSQNTPSEMSDSPVESKQLHDLQNLPEDPALGAMRASEAAFAARDNSGGKKPE